MAFRKNEKGQDQIKYRLGRKGFIFVMEELKQRIKPKSATVK